MPVVGFLVGGLASRIGAAVDWISVALLLGAGLWILKETREGGEEIVEALEKAQQGIAALAVVALSVSLDELAVGVAFGTFRPPIVPVLVAIAVQAAVVSLLGIRLGARLGERAGTRATLIAGVVLCLLAVGVGVSNVVGR